MPVRIQNWSPDGGRGESKGDPRLLAAQHQVSAAVVDEAVESALSDMGLAGETGDVIRKLLATDVESGVAHHYYSGMASASLQRAHVHTMRRDMNIPYALTDDQTNKLSAYAPDFKLSFRDVGRESHDHPMAAASRLIDRAVIADRIPPGVRVCDIGGEVYTHVARGQLGRRVHVCAPIVDVKDPARKVQTDLRVRQLVQNPDTSDAVQASAQAYLRGDRAAVCDLLAQLCKWRSDVITSVHVYDVPIADWPLVIENKHARLVEGCMLFSPQVFDEVSGEFETAEAIYEIDRASLRFRMGFKNSPSWFYDHDWLDYLKYGVDQELMGKKGTYSYRIVERRGDTIFFRILPVEGVPRQFMRQVYKLPRVRMVEVYGFQMETRRVRDVPKRRVYTWPLPLWQDMMTHAELMLERGVFDLTRMFNYYRTVAPRQTINAVLVAGGYTVSMRELAPLVVHVSLAAAVTVMKAQVESRAQVDHAIGERARRTESTVHKMLVAVGSALQAATGFVCYPLLWLEGLLEKAAFSVVMGNVISWQPETVIREVDVKLLLANHESRPDLGSITGSSDFLDEMELSAPFDHVTAAFEDPALAKVVVEGFADVLPEQILGQLREVVDKNSSKPEKETVVPKPQSGPSTTAIASSIQLSKEDYQGRVRLRKDAILEAITQCQLEQRKVQSSCASTYAELMTGSSPNRSALVARREEYRNPDMWLLRAGIFEKSVLGADPSGVMHSAVYTPVADADTESFLRPVYFEKFSGYSQGKYVERDHPRIADATYSGWALVCDSLEVYNGPEIVKSLQLALDGALNFDIILHQGPPGCGKTTSIVRSTRPDDVVMCPVRKSVRETAERLVTHDAALSETVKTRVRTLDSYLVNYLTNKRVSGLSAERLLADEVFMSHSGKWLAAAALLGVAVVEAYGDQFQIPPVSRAEAPSMYLKLRPDKVYNEWLSHRCPPDAVAAWGHIYDWCVRSTRQDITRTIRHVVSAVGLPIQPGHVMMGMYQADKKTITQLYKGCGVRIHVMTVHESQGNTYEHVRLHRFENRKRQDTFSLYDKPPYVLVAMSRHTQSFEYVSPDLGDVVMQFIKQASNVRRVAAASQVETAGESHQYG